MEVVCFKIQWVAGAVGESRVLGSRFLVDRQKVVDRLRSA